MAATEVKNFDSPDETRPFEGNGKADVVNIGGQTVGRGTFEPGWRWSNNVKPIAGTDSCQVAHLAYVLSGLCAGIALVVCCDGGPGKTGADDGGMDKDMTMEMGGPPPGPGRCGT